ncbi:MAG TPA: DNA-3-methyladenine glycosylase I [Actinobacteria bacterium]|nr:DNA-3-methyladenine glycosylase I [Actinomycetota bacterium]
MEKPKSYCEFVENLEKSNVHRAYHDTKYGFPITSDSELFERLVLEINQAGLSWTTILNKQENFRKAYSEFNVRKLARFNEENIEKLLSDPGIIRNKLKINATIFNAQKIVDIQGEYGSFKSWLDYNNPLQLDDWVELFKKTFKFTGREITKEFLTSTGYLKGAHEKDCPIFNKIIQEGPMWDKSSDPQA